MTRSSAARRKALYEENLARMHMPKTIDALRAFPKELRVQAFELVKLAATEVVAYVDKENATRLDRIAATLAPLGGPDGGPITLSRYLPKE